MGTFSIPSEKQKAAFSRLNESVRTKPTKRFLRTSKIGSRHSKGMEVVKEVYMN